MALEPNEKEHLVLNYYAAKAELADAQRDFDAAQTALADYMASQALKTVRIKRDNAVMQVTYTVNTSVKIDEDGLRKALGAKVFDTYTKRVLDRKALEDAMEKGDVSSVAVTPFVTTKRSAPFINFTMKEDTDEV